MRSLIFITWLKVKNYISKVETFKKALLSLGFGGFLIAVLGEVITNLITDCISSNGCFVQEQIPSKPINGEIIDKLLEHQNAREGELSGQIKDLQEKLNSQKEKQIAANKNHEKEIIKPLPPQENNEQKIPNSIKRSSDNKQAENFNKPINDIKLQDNETVIDFESKEVANLSNDLSEFQNDPVRELEVSNLKPEFRNSKISVFEKAQFGLCGYQKFMAEISGRNAVTLTSKDRKIPNIPFQGYKREVKLNLETELWPGCFVIPRSSNTIGVTRIAFSIREKINE